MIMLDIDMPKSCSECPLTAYSDMYVEDYCTVNGAYDEDKRPDDCPIVAELEQEPCKDAISREAVHRKVLEEWNKVFTDEDIRFSNIADFVIDSPSVTPIHKKGKWITEPGIGCRCSECGQPPYPYQTDSSGDDYWKPGYCPNCGRKMESEDKE